MQWALLNELIQMYNYIICILYIYPHTVLNLLFAVFFSVSSTFFLAKKNSLHFRFLLRLRTKISFKSLLYAASLVCCYHFVSVFSCLFSSRLCNTFCKRWKYSISLPLFKSHFNVHRRSNFIYVLICSSFILCIFMPFSIPKIGQYATAATAVE